MPEAEASAFVKERTRSQPGDINRSVTVRINYSLMSWMIAVGSSISTAFAPYIHSIEVYGDESRQRRLAVITAKAGTPITAFLPETRRAAQVATKVIGKYPYTAGCRDYPCKNRVEGTLTLTDIGVELSGGETANHPSQLPHSTTPSTRLFLDAFAVNGFGSTRLWRAETAGSYGDHYISVVWRPFENSDHEAKMNFADLHERDRFWVDLTAAVQAWAIKYSQFVFAKLDIDQRCSNSQGFYPCTPNAIPDYGEGTTAKPGKTVPGAPDAHTAGEIAGDANLMSDEALRNLPRIWRWESKHIDLRVEVTHDLFRAEWMNILESAAKRGAYGRVECRREASKWEGSFSGNMVFAIPGVPTKQATKLCAFAERIEVDSISLEKITGRIESMASFDVNTCGGPPGKWLDFTWVPKK